MGEDYSNNRIRIASRTIVTLVTKPSSNTRKHIDYIKARDRVSSTESFLLQTWILMPLLNWLLSLSLNDIQVMGLAASFLKIKLLILYCDKVLLYASINFQISGKMTLNIAKSERLNTYV